MCIHVYVYLHVYTQSTGRITVYMYVCTMYTYILINNACTCIYYVLYIFSNRYVLILQHYFVMYRLVYQARPSLLHIMLILRAFDTLARQTMYRLERYVTHLNLLRELREQFDEEQQDRRLLNGKGLPQIKWSSH